jgi:hypothetical protein
MIHTLAAFLNLRAKTEKSHGFIPFKTLVFKFQLPIVDIQLLRLLVPPIDPVCLLFLVLLPDLTLPCWIQAPLSSLL